MISIVIPAYNQHELTLDCITAIRKHTNQDCEIIIIDNGSTPPIKQPYTGFIETTIIRDEENLGFPKAVNQGIQSAKGEYIILLNNDVIVTPGWADKLINALDQFDIVGPMTNYCAGLQRVQIPAYSNEDELNKSSGEWAGEYEGETQPVNFVIGFCMAFRRSLFEEVGEFDISLWPCSGEEVDFCYKSKELGYTIGIVKDCYVHHEGSQTFQIMDVDYQEICERNDKHLAEKWGNNFWKQEIEKVKTPGVRLNLGCGYRKIEGYINIDNRAIVEPDLLCDVTLGLPYSDNSVDEIRAYDFMEHIPIGKVIPVMEDFYRVLKPGGILEISVPSTDGRGAFQDPTHVSFWNKNSFWYYTDDESRKLYGINVKFDIELLEDRVTDNQNLIIHTCFTGRAVK